MNIVNCCSFCYLSLDSGSELRCGKCIKRKYCSKTCQVNDWNQGHKHWCCKAGEIGYDYEIKPSSKYKGLGVFALRDFNRSEKIMAQRGLSIDNIAELNFNHKSNLTNAILDLEPKESDLIADKFDLNSLDCGPKKNPVLCLHASRINHQCPFVENCSHLWIDEHNIKLIYAKSNIKAGEELTLSYIDSFNSYSELKEKWGFECGCEGCSNPHNMVYQKEIVKLSTFITNNKIDSKIRIDACDKLINLYSKANIPVMMYQITYWDKLNLQYENEFFKETKETIKKCMELELEITGFESKNYLMLKTQLLLLGV